VKAIVLAAGAGTRLRPLTTLRPKALCPVDNVALLDRALERATSVATELAVNAHHHAAQIVAHVDARAHVSVEPQLLGTGGAIGNLLQWIDGEAVLTLNADAYHGQDLAAFCEGWDGRTVRLLVVHDPARADFDDGLRFAGAALMPFDAVQALPATFCSLYAEVWKPCLQDGRADLWRSYEPFFDCGTPRDYLEANMHASGGKTVVGDGAQIRGRAERCVLWPHVTVAADEHLREVIRARDDVTVSVE
jgi:N-acetyl-alpha-D-muramate 1-phosphate uridylyltransferase